MKNKLKIQIYSDGADLKIIRNHIKKKNIKGFTTNPTLMKKSGIKEYSKFAKKCIQICRNKPISFEVISDNHEEMIRQAKIIASWGKNVYVKIPIVNSKGKSSIPVLKTLLEKNIKCNVTAVFTQSQISKIAKIVSPKSNLIISIFAGRIADTGLDPSSLVMNTVQMFKRYKYCKILWASPREILNVIQADNAGCHIITLTEDLMKKMSLFGKNLHQYSVETSRMFYKDSKNISFK